MSDDNILESYRDSIDNIDAALVFMLAERFKITQAVGEHKAKSSLPPADPAREERQIDSDDTMRGRAEVSRHQGGTLDFYRVTLAIVHCKRVGRIPLSKRPSEARRGVEPARQEHDCGTHHTPRTAAGQRILWI